MRLPRGHARRRMTSIQIDSRTVFRVAGLPLDRVLAATGGDHVVALGAAKLVLAARAHNDGLLAATGDRLPARTRRNPHVKRDFALV